FEETDRQDGRVDGRWHELHLDGARAEEALLTPARIPFQTRLVREVIEREGFGDDDIPDLLFINYKLIDEIGHQYSMNSVEMRDSVEAQDADLPTLIDLLNEHVGEGVWAMALTADHGHTPDPEVSGAAVISPAAVADVIQAEFDHDEDDTRIVEFTQPTQVFIDVDEMEGNDATLEEIAAYLLTVTKSDVQGGQYPVSADVADEPAFLAVYPSDMIDDLPCLEGEIPDHGSKDALPAA
ncbi:MAG: alkaline phosphatase family protein, partial [Actinomycetota bacterium]